MLKAKAQHLWGGFTIKWYGKHVYYGRDAAVARQRVEKDISTNGPVAPPKRAQSMGSACKLFMERQRLRFEQGDISEVQLYNTIVNVASFSLSPARPRSCHTCAAPRRR